MPPPRGSTASDQADPAGRAPPGSPCRAPGTSAGLPWSSHPTRVKGQDCACTWWGLREGSSVQGRGQPRGGSEPRGHSLGGAR